MNLHGKLSTIELENRVLTVETTGAHTEGVMQKRADLSGAPGMEVIISTGEYKIGEAIDLHIHHGIEAAYVIQGASVQ